MQGGRESIQEQLRDLAVHIAEFVTQLITKRIIPSVMWLHRNGVFEPFAFLFSIILTAKGLRMQPEAGMYVTMSGLVALNSCPLYSYILRGEEQKGWINENKR